MRPWKGFYGYRDIDQIIKGIRDTFVTIQSIFYHYGYGNTKLSNFGGISVIIANFFSGIRDTLGIWDTRASSVYITVKGADRNFEVVPPPEG